MVLLIAFNEWCLEYLSKLVPSSLPDEHKALLAHHFESLITAVYLLLAPLMLHMTEP